MDDLETRLREELHHAVDHVEVSPGLWEEIRRRHRKEPRRRMFELATSLVVLAVAAAVMLPIAFGAIERSQGPAGGDDGEAFGSVVTTDLPMLESDQLAPIEGANGPVPVLARGEVDGRPWMFTAFLESAVMYAGFPQPEPGMVDGGWYPGGSLDILANLGEPPIISRTVTGAPGSPRFVVAAVDPEVTRARIELPAGQTAEFPVAPEIDWPGLSSRMELSWVVIPVSAGVQVDGARLTVFDESGRELESATVAGPAGPPVGPLGLERATGAVAAITSGEFEGERWELLAHEYAEGICYGFDLEPPNTVGGSASCDPYDGMPASGAVSVVVDGAPDVPTFVYGVVREEAAVVRVEFPDGTVHEVSPAGHDHDFPVAFYVLAVPPAGAPSVNVTAYDATGNQLGPPPEPLRPAPASTPVPPASTPAPPPEPSAGGGSIGDVRTEDLPVLEGDDLLGAPGSPSGPLPALATGEMDGHPWVFTAYESGGRLATGYPQPQPDIEYSAGGWGAGSGPIPLGEGNAPEVGIGWGGSTDGPTFIDGHVVKEATRVHVELSTGETADVPVVGQDAGLEVNFYVVPVASGVDLDGTVLTAYDASGRPLESVVIADDEGIPMGVSPFGLELAAGPVVTLDSGEIDGLPWEFAAYRWAHRSVGEPNSHGICFGFIQGDGAVCDASTADSPVGTGVMADSGQGQLSLVWGAMPRDAEVVHIQLPDGREFDLPPLGQDEFGVSFFVMAFPPGTPVDGVTAEAGGSG